MYIYIFLFLYVRISSYKCMLVLTLLLHMLYVILFHCFEYAYGTIL